MTTLRTPYVVWPPVPPLIPKIQLRFRLLRDGEVTKGAKILRLFRDYDDLKAASLVFYAEEGEGEYTNTCSVSLAVFLAQGEWLAMAVDDALPRRIRTNYLALTGPGTYTFNITSPVDKPEGYGYLAGEFPNGITTRLDTPVSATIRVFYTNEQGQAGKVAETVSNPDGTWVVDNLDPTKQFDVICSLPGFNDLILSKVSPTPY